MLEHFRCDVRRRPDAFLSLPFRHRSRQPEIPQLQRRLGGDEDILRFDVAVDNALGVEALQRRQKLLRPCHNDGLGHAVALLRAEVPEVVPEVPARAVLHDCHHRDDARDCLLARKDVEIAHHVGVRDLAERLGLLECLPRVGFVPAQYELQHHQLAALLRPHRSQVAISHPPSSDLPHDLVIAHHRALAQGRHVSSGPRGECTSSTNTALPAFPGSPRF
mmetsp:Transcript_61894/g.147410  ORF Transcript_61894/g.147410 Transcript_61894/m.147410 type:complete len:220 (+) Transcript_61894:255-914(+)